jgi:hypothetical protein
MISYIKTDEGLTAVIGGKSYSVTSDNPSYTQVLDAISAEESEQDIVDLFNSANAVKRYFEGNLEVTDYNEILFDGEPVHNVVVDRIFEFIDEGLPYRPLLAFLKRLQANPSRRAVQELYTFLEHKSLPITEDGFFLGYKGVTNEYRDVHSGRFSNRVGVTNEMPRAKVDDDFRNHCSYGFHVGSLEYATTWGSRTVIVKVDPADCVSVPSDCNCQKLRVCKYTVVSDYKGALPKPLVDDENDPYEYDVDHTYDY